MSKRAKVGPKGTPRARLDLTGYVDVASFPEYDYETSGNMAKTFRESGSVGAGKAKLPPYVAHIATPQDLILDYGAGDTIPHTRWLRSLGLNVVATDQMFDPDVHDPYAFNHKYDIIMCSNVLNVQTTPRNIVNVIYQLRSVIKPDGVLVVNYPESPRRIKSITDSDIETVLRSVQQKAHDFSHGMNALIVIYIKL